jgi:16S rRNA (adenine1518-N6/adenine1519-N6)-dimethyltransferase
VPIANPALLVKLVRSTFTQRRKTMANAMATFAATRGRDAKAVLAAAGIDPIRRPETISLTEFARLAEALSSP